MDHKQCFLTHSLLETSRPHCNCHIYRHTTTKSDRHSVHRTKLSKSRGQRKSKPYIGNTYLCAREITRPTTKHTILLALFFGYLGEKGTSLSSSSVWIQHVVSGFGMEIFAPDNFSHDVLYDGFQIRGC